MVFSLILSDTRKPPEFTLLLAFLIGKMVRYFFFDPSFIYFSHYFFFFFTFFFLFTENVDEALSDGEQAMTGVFAGFFLFFILFQKIIFIFFFCLTHPPALYGIAFFVTILILIKGMHSLTLSLLVLFVYVLATFSFRTAFWAIVASGDYEETSAGYYILIEPPRYIIILLIF